MNALLLLPLFFVTAPQTAPHATPPQRTSTKRPAAQTKTIVGVITALDATKNTLTLQPDNGTVAIAASIAPDAAFTKKNEIAKLTDFAVKDHVSVRLSIRPDKPAEAVLKAMKDADTATETKKTATAIYTGTTVSSSLTNLDAKDKDGKTTRFRVSEKTIFIKGGKPAKPSDFAPDAPVAVIARSSPSGNLLASHIADTASAAEQAKNDALSTWTGQVTEKKDGKLTLKREDGAMRTVQIAETSSALFDKLTPGRKVHLHLIKGETDKDGHRTTDKFTNAR
jgi:hypothetical protein